VGTKTDLSDGDPSPAARLAALRAKYPGETVLDISVFSGEGLGDLAACLGKLAAQGDREDSGGWGNT
jgi:GTP-binding protein